MSETPEKPTFAWRTGFSWFAAEFAVVVTGVLVALALNAWWSASQDRALEAQYLEQLQEDLSRTLERMENEDQLEQSSDRALTQLVRAYRMNPAPPRDSLLAWSLTAPNVMDSAPVLGTVETIVSSGDLRLIRDDSLRFALPTFLETSRSLRDTKALFKQQFVEATWEMWRHVDYTGLIQQAIPASIVDSLAASDPMFILPANGTRRLIQSDNRNPLDNPELYTVFSLMHTAQRNMDATRTALITINTSMLELIRAASD